MLGVARHERQIVVRVASCEQPVTDLEPHMPATRLPEAELSRPALHPGFRS